MCPDLDSTPDYLAVRNAKSPQTCACGLGCVFVDQGDDNGVDRSVVRRILRRLGRRLAFRARRQTLVHFKY